MDPCVGSLKALIRGCTSWNPNQGGLEFVCYLGLTFDHKIVWNPCSLGMRFLDFCCHTILSSKPIYPSFWCFQDLRTWFKVFVSLHLLVLGFILSSMNFSLILGMPLVHLDSQGIVGHSLVVHLCIIVH